MESYAQDMVEHLRETGHQISPSLAKAILDVPKSAFVDEAFVTDHVGRWVRRRLDFRLPRDIAMLYHDRPIAVQIRNGLPSISCTMPSTMVKMFEALDLRRGDNVLEIGTGTGYTAALMSEMVGDPDSVTSIEIDGSFAERARRNLDSVGLKALRVSHADGSYGYEAKAPYDRIVVNSSTRYIPRWWQDQLSNAGMLVVIRKDPDTQQLLQLRREGGRIGGWSDGIHLFP